MRIKLLSILSGAVLSTACFYAFNSKAVSPEIPSLIGDWRVEAEGASLLHGTSYSKTSHHAERFTTFSAIASIEEQVGRRIAGVITSPRHSEKFVGVIGLDGKSLIYVDEDGVFLGKIVSQDLIVYEYNHVHDNESVVASGSYTRINK